MADFDSPFEPALPRQLKWSVGENQFDNDGRYPRSLSLFVPADSIVAFAEHLMALARMKEQHKTGKVYNYETQQDEKVPGIYLNAKGKSGEYGDFGSINPKKLAGSETLPPKQAKASPPVIEDDDLF